LYILSTKKVQIPYFIGENSKMVVALAAPLRVTVAPLPLLLGLSVPEML
jgi:hypothetical protein